jgi:hypothetical protein
MSIFRAARDRIRPRHGVWVSRCWDWLNVYVRTDHARRCVDEAGAMVLLKDNLSVAQREQLRRFGYFEVVAARPEEGIGFEVHSSSSRLWAISCEQSNGTSILAPTSYRGCSCPSAGSQ